MWMCGASVPNNYCTYQCKPSNDPNCPIPNGASETFDVSTYYYDYAATQEGAIPVHKHCLQIFKKALAREKGFSLAQLDSVDLNPDILFSTMRQKRLSQGLRCLDIDYFELVKNKREQYFIFELQTLPSLLDPLHVTAIKDYINIMPIVRPDPETKPASLYPQSLHDSLFTLPPEILLEILMILPTESFTTFMAASPTARQIQLTPSFWRKRIELQMPWSWEVIAHAAQRSESYDWER
ncbi:hypothetical protein F5050DRAFT_1779288 [Lentinula boryana]|uniref:F-box domain-containing protein n=1 Tax=Lentinula boryana TaxID=40481 RepID=A0ABQ8Q5J9_9AGAR|nr:hypothetical protein F5050DRAFT_1779288 [Lentinula boryana]